MMMGGAGAGAGGGPGRGGGRFGGPTPFSNGSCFDIFSNNNNQAKDISDEIRDLILKERDDANPEERQQAWNDIHGNFPIDEQQEPNSSEDPLFFSALINNFDLAVRNLTRGQRQQLDRAYFYCPSLPTGHHQLKMMFIRRVKYDPTEAASLMAKFFHLKADLFGIASLGREITIEDDFSKEEIAKIATSIFETPLFVPNSKDTSGRAVAFCHTKFLIRMPGQMRTVKRWVFYQVMIQLKNDIELQKKGAVFVIYCPFQGELLKDIPTIPEMTQSVQDFETFLSSLPYKETSFHFCHDSSVMNFLNATFYAAFGKHKRMRMTAHYGSVTEIRHSLLSYGINLDERYFYAPSSGQGFTTTMNSQVSAPASSASTAAAAAVSSLLASESAGYYSVHNPTTLLEEHIQYRCQIESEEKRQRGALEQSLGIIIHPQPKDVLIGRGRPYRDWVGNQRWGNLVATQLPRLDHIDRFGKSCLSMQIVKDIQEYGGRFLQREEGQGWTVMDDNMARDRTVRAFRPRKNK